MENALRIYSSELSENNIADNILAVGRVANPQFQVTESGFNVHNMVSTAVDEIPTVGKALVSVTTGAIGGSGLNNQNQAVDPSLWLPPFRRSEASLETLQRLDASERVQFTIQNTGTGAEDFFLPQSTYLGHLDWTGTYDVKPRRPYLYATPTTTLAALGTLTQKITIQPEFDDRTLHGLLCTGFLSNFQNRVLVTIRDESSGYAFTNVPVISSNIAYDMRTENNYKPQGFKPFLMPARHRYAITWKNLDPDHSVEVNFAFRGELVTWTKS